MRRRHTHLVPLLVVLALPSPPPSQADGLKITGVTLGIGGLYRPGGWLPVTVTVVNTGADAAQGRLEAAPAEPNGGGAVFARSVAVSAGPGPQTFPVDVRGLDPSRQNIVVRLASEIFGSEIAESAAPGRNVFSGVPLGDRDLLLVGFSADPSAFTPLNGQAWGLRHTAGGITQDDAAQAPPAAVRVAAAGSADLPDKSAAYAGVDAVLLRADAPLDSLSEAQTDALKTWVVAGGRLIVCGGADPALFANAFFAGLLPARVSPTLGASPVLTPKPLAGVRVLAAAAGRPTAVTGPYGAGQVTLLAFDPTLPPASGPALWRTIFAAGPSPLMPAVVAREAETAGRSGLSEAVLHAPALDVPGADAVGLFLLAYVLLLVPVNYLILKRLDKKEWAWGTIPLLVAAFAVGTYAVGSAAKGSRVFVNRAALVETTAGQQTAGLSATVGLFSPRRASYDLTVAGPNVLVAAPGQSAVGDGGGPLRIVEEPGQVLAKNVAVNMWAMRVFDMQSATDLGGTITATISAKPGGRALTVSNRTPHSLHDCRLLVDGAWAPVGALGPGAASGPYPFGGTPPVSAGWGGFPAVAGDGETSDVRRRMRSALADFVRSLGPVPPGDAILAGWCDDPILAGPPVQVDGRAVAENAVTLVIVHIPLR